MTEKKYEVLFSGALGHYRGEVVPESEFSGYGASLAPYVEMGAIREVTDESPSLRDQVPESDLTDGDGAAVTTGGVNISPLAPPQKTDGELPDVLPQSTLDSLKAAGYDSADKIAAASDDDLKKVQGVGDATVAKLRALQAG